MIKFKGFVGFRRHFKKSTRGRGVPSEKPNFGYKKDKFSQLLTEFRSQKFENNVCKLFYLVNQAFISIFRVNIIQIDKISM